MKINSILLYVSCLAFILNIQGCSKTSVNPCTQQASQDRIDAVDQTQLKSDIAAIDKYLADNAIVAIKDPSGLRYVIKTTGDDARPCLESAVIVMYAGRFFNGKGFDAAVDPVKFRLEDLILGWHIAFTQFGKGTKATLYIPSGLCYGKNASAKIPANSNLIFDIDLISF